MSSPPRTRFAPSPTGHLHVGNAYSALCCQRWAEEHRAELLLRIEDIDHTRCRPIYEQTIIEDLRWLGIQWHGPVLRQSEHMPLFQQALKRLHAQGLIYPCFCTRKTIQQEVAQMASAPHSQHGAPYPGICRHIPEREASRRMRNTPFAWRLHAERVCAALPPELTWIDGQGRHHPATLEHDLVIGRKDIGISYHLAVVIDDARQGISDVIRGRDLRAHTGIHRILQYLLGLPSPRYHHHPLLQDTHGTRLAKRKSSTELRALRLAGVSPLRLRDFLLHECNGVWPFHSVAEAVQTLGKG
ncbi:MAG: tRNA glutamyl-Q(34) synthetase GluQRS [Zetaproteobacteria bacterium]|nr:MAG: tRNA glutamyl-Q(34) synthetase GluQRS [Zetaproteobacteria bacterium]